MKIKAYRQDDKAAVIDPLRSTTPAYFAVAEEQDLVRDLHHIGEACYVSEDNYRVVGAGGINYFPKERVARISRDIIAPDSQGKGSGRKLTAFRINRLSPIDYIDRIVVRTIRSAPKFYEKSGFVLRKTAKGFWTENFALYHMELNNNHHDV